MDQREATSQAHPLQLSEAQIPTGPNWSIISTDAAWTSSKACLSGIIQRPNSPPFLSWFQVSNEDKPLQAEARAALLALSIAKDRVPFDVVGDSVIVGHPDKGGGRQVLSQLTP
ncbi:hypothetical protein CRG98_019449 [Punica granatum]|uniref:RNase H type-1 domain-containing protein n=1 Tax=Punica granatum TaxID=22663 RepID=A0A2I0JV20_PUNGR|nr:hypothetical protein CRG98_019449 [Punica granatum]